MSLSLDDFEWVEQDFDFWVLQHKTKDARIAHIRYRSGAGWQVLVAKEIEYPDDLRAQDFDSAKVIAALHASKRMEEYEKTINQLQPSLRSATERGRLRNVPKGVFQME